MIVLMILAAWVAASVTFAVRLATPAAATLRGSVAPPHGCAVVAVAPALAVWRSHAVGSGLAQALSPPQPLSPPCAA